MSRAARSIARVSRRSASRAPDRPRRAKQNTLFDNEADFGNFGRGGAKTSA